MCVKKIQGNVGCAGALLLPHSRRRALTRNISRTPRRCKQKPPPRNPLGPIRFSPIRHLTVIKPLSQFDLYWQGMNDEGSSQPKPHFRHCLPGPRAPRQKVVYHMCLMRAGNRLQPHVRTCYAMLFLAWPQQCSPDDLRYAAVTNSIDQGRKATG